MKIIISFKKVQKFTFLHFFNFQAIRGFEGVHFLQKFFEKFTPEKIQGRKWAQIQTTQCFAKSRVLSCTLRSTIKNQMTFVIRFFILQR